MTKDEIESDIDDIERVVIDLTETRQVFMRLNEMVKDSELDQADDLLKEAIDKLESTVVELQDRAELTEEESEDGDE